MTDIGVIGGAGYVGLVTSVGLAALGHKVVSMDLDKTRLEMLRSGKSAVYEEGLEPILGRLNELGQISFTDDQSKTVRESDVLFIAVGTPSLSDGAADLSAVIAVAEQLRDEISKYTVIVVKSTVPVGTLNIVTDILSQKLTEGEDFDVVSNPEFLREGNAIDDFRTPDRVVCGVESEEAQAALEQLYAPFTGDGHPLLFFDIHSSEMVKYASNAMLACKISFINEIASLCERNGANIERVRTGMCADSRIGHQFFKPGIGYGGSCFPKDTLAVMEMGDNANAPCLVNTAVHELNQRQRRWFANRILEHFDNDLTGKKVALWGLAFKPNTDDVRDAPSIDIAKTLIDAGAEVTGFDPEAWETYGSEVPEVTIVSNMYEAAADADALVICTEWDEFSSPDFDLLKAKLKDQVIFDGRNLYIRAEMARHGFHYYSVGRPTLEICTA